MKNSIKAGLTPVLALAVLLSALTACNADPAAKVPLVLNLPDATLKGTPVDLPTAPNIEPIPDKPVPFMVPPGVTNLAFGKPVTSSSKPWDGDLSQITDGKKAPEDSDAVEFKKGVQWVQVDLGASYPLYAIAVWHDHRYIQIMHAVVVQVSDDPEFKTGVTTLYNNDKDNAVGLGVGSDLEYFETRQGKILDAKGIKARYIRGYTKGGSMGASNCWQEIEAYGLPN